MMNSQKTFRVGSTYTDTNLRQKI